MACSYTEFLQSLRRHRDSLVMNISPENNKAVDRATFQSPELNISDIHAAIGGTEELDAFSAAKDIPDEKDGQDEQDGQGEQDEQVEQDERDAQDDDEGAGSVQVIMLEIIPVRISSSHRRLLRRLPPT